MNKNVSPAPNTVLVRGSKRFTTFMPTECGFAHLFLVVVIVIIGIGGLLFLSWQKGLTKTTPTQETSPTPDKATSQAPTGDLANWKTYTNTKFNYQVSVPSNWNITPYSDDPEQADQVDLLLRQSITIRISTLPNQENLSLREFLIKKFDRTDVGYDTPEAAEKAAEASKESAEATVDRMLRSRLDGKEAFAFEDKEQTYIKINNYILAITLSSYTTGEKYDNEIIQLFDQILSTFNFLDIPFTTIEEGIFGGIEETSKVVITNRNDWESLWNRIHAKKSPKPQLPQIDFNNEMVLAVFQGQQKSGGYAINITDIHYNDNYVEVIVKESQPPKDQDFITILAITNPYHIVRLAKVDKKIVFKKI